MPFSRAKAHVHLRCETDLLEQLDHAAELLHTSRTRVIKDALRAYLSRRPLGTAA
jgi:predicted transcriptional regulator